MSRRRAARYAQEALLSIAFTQLALTPYFLCLVGLSWDQYGVWAASNMAVSALLGPALVAVVRWVR
jgi:hypothetical protein